MGVEPRYLGKTTEDLQQDQDHAAIEAAGVQLRQAKAREQKTQNLARRMGQTPPSQRGKSTHAKRAGQF